MQFHVENQIIDQVLFLINDVTVDVIKKNT